jgi:hypothetical protein
MRYQSIGPGLNRPAQLADNGEWLDTPKSGGWLQEWIAEQGQYVKLRCGHNEDLNFRGIILIGKRVYCEHCEVYSEIDKPIKFAQYAGLTLRAQSEQPPF